MAKTLREIFNLPPGDSHLDNFLSDLTKLGRKHGVGISNGQLFMLEPEDRQHAYTADAESVINLN